MCGLLFYLLFCSDLFWEQHYNIQELDISYGEEADKNLKQYSLPEAVETLIERGEYDNKESEVTKVCSIFLNLGQRSNICEAIEFV